MEHIEPPGFDILDNPEVGALKHRIEELLADNDSMRLDLWAKDTVIRVLAERINEMEQEVP